MRWRLTDKPKVRYSPAEQELFQLLPGSGQRISINELVEARYKRPPMNARIIIGGVARKLQAKIVENKEPFRLRRSKRRGPHPIEVWLEAA